MSIRGNAPRTAPTIWAPGLADGDMQVRRVHTNNTIYVLCIGDSITFGSDGPGLAVASPNAVNTLANTLSAILGITVVCINVGVGGSTAATWAPGGANDTAALAALAGATSGLFAVQIMLGTNDAAAAHRTTAGAYGAAMFALVNAWVQRGAAYTLIHQSPYCSSDATTAGLLAQYRAAFEAICTGGAVLLGDESFYALTQAQPGTYLSSDGIHPSQAGHDRMAAAWATQHVDLCRNLGTFRVWQPLRVGANLSIVTGTTYDTLNAATVAAPPPHYEPLVRANPGGTAPLFVVNRQGSPIVIKVAN